MRKVIRKADAVLPAPLSPGKAVLLTFCSAVLLTLAFPRPGLWPLAWAALIPLFFAIEAAGTKQSFFLGWLFGFLHHTGIAYWVFYAFYMNSNAGLIVSLLFLLVVIGGFGGLYSALFALAARRVIRAGGPAAVQACAVACCWVCLEYCRSHFLTDMPWELLGHSQYPWTRLIQIADITGVYGLSLLIVLTNYALYSSLRNCRFKAAARALATPALLISAVLAYGSIRLVQFPPVQEAPSQDGDPVAVVQGSFPQHERWKPETWEMQLRTHLRLSREAVAQGARVVVWPESSIQSYLQEKFPGPLLDFLREYNIVCIIGAPRYEQRSAGYYTYYNAALLVDRSGIRDVHDKLHLLPFGEYFPLGFMDLLRLRYSGPRQYSPADRFNLLHTPSGRMGVLICYEVIFPELARGFVMEGADILINISNDAWFGRSSAHYQHFSMAVCTAASFKRPVLRAANTGISGVIDAAGRPVSSLAPFTEGFLLYTPTPTGTITVYCRYGDLFAGLCFAAGLALLFIPKRFARSRKR